VKTAKEKTRKVSFSFPAPEAQTVSVAGDFNNWNPETDPMKKDRRGVWKRNLNLPPGTYQYRVFVDGQWQNDPFCASCVGNPYGTLNCVRKVD
jgi:1,4-alpha-glucan branching enzyme